MNIKKLLATTVLTVAVGSMATASQDVLASQKLLNSLGYNAGPMDGVVGAKTTNAITNYYADKGMTFDGTIDGNEVALLTTDAGNISLSVEEKANQLGLTLSGHYIDETMKNKIGKYVLPSNQWFGAHINSDKGVFYKTGSAFGDWNGDGDLDYLGFGVGHRCGSGGTSGTYTTVGGRQGCKYDNALYNPMIPFSIDSTFHYFKMDNSKVFDFGSSDDWGYAATLQRMIVEDFNGDGIDDFFVPNASVQIRNGKHSYESVNNVLISNGPKSWVQGYHTGFLTNSKHKTYMGFSHGADAGDIDNDGDIDVLTSHFKGVVCHFNDGKGNFKSVLCNKQNGLSLTVGDYNNDGNLDVITSHGFYNPKYAKYSPEGWSSKKNEKTVLLYGNGKGKFKKAQELKPAMHGKFAFSTLAEMTSFDFDNDGDVDVLTSAVGPYYTGSAWVMYENVGGKFNIKSVNMLLEPLAEWQNPKVWGSMIKDEFSHPWNTYCNESILIDVNSDGLMDAMCSNTRQDIKSANLFLLNKGNMNFEIKKPEEMSKYVHWMK
jgi:hypothetical protein